MYQHAHVLAGGGIIFYYSELIGRRINTPLHLCAGIFIRNPADEGAVTLPCLDSDHGDNRRSFIGRTLLFGVGDACLDQAGLISEGEKACNADNKHSQDKKIYGIGGEDDLLGLCRILVQLILPAAGYGIGRRRLLLVRVPGGITCLLARIILRRITGLLVGIVLGCITCLLIGIVLGRITCLLVGIILGIAFLWISVRLLLLLRLRLHWWLLWLLSRIALGVRLGERSSAVLAELASRHITAAALGAVGH